jgi:phosphohistidine phosphatase
VEEVPGNAGFLEQSLMEIILWRHAEAEDGLADEQRKLTSKGEKQARRMAAWLKARLPENTVIMVSPAVRAQQTAQALTRDFETRTEVGTSADAASVLKAAGWPKARRAVLVVGHQPTLGQVAALLVSGRPTEWSIKKGAVWWLASRSRAGVETVTVRAVVAPDLV